MNLTDLQNMIVDELNKDSVLVGGGVLAMAEDSLDILDTITRHLAQVGGVAAVVGIPVITRNGFTEGGIPFDADSVTIAVEEIVAVNRARPGAMTALQAAQRIAHILDGDTFEFRSIRQTANEQNGILSASVEFAYSGIINP